MIRPDKGQLTLVEAARLALQQRPDARFVFVGEGTGSRKLGIRLHEAIERYGLEHRILMLGYRWDIPDILAACDLVVIASLRTEASPIVLREALASGRPVVATRVGDVDEVIHHGKHGLIVSPGAQEEMAAAILELLQNRELAAKLRAQRFTTRARTILLRSHDASQTPGRFRSSNTASGSVCRASSRATRARLHQELKQGGQLGLLPRRADGSERSCPSHLRTRAAQSLLELDGLKPSSLRARICLFDLWDGLRSRSATQSHALGAINRIDQLPKTSEAAAMRSKNEPRQAENLGLVSFLG